MAILAFVTLVAFLIWAARHRGSVDPRPDAHACLGCGYDLRGTPERCPECGRPAPRRLDRGKLRRPAEPAERMSIGPLVDPADAIVHETLDGEQARLLRLQLRARGIPAELADVPDPAHPLRVVFHVRVATADQRRAAAIIDRFDVDPPGT